MLYTVAGECAVVVRDSPFGRAAIVQAGGVNSVQIVIAKCEGVVVQSSTQGHDSNSVIADSNLITSSDVDGSEEVAGGSNTQSLVTTDDDVLLAGNELIGSIHLNERHGLKGLGSDFLGVGSADNLALSIAQNGLGIEGGRLINHDGRSVVGEVLAIVAVLDSSTSGSTGQGNREVLLKGGAILRIKHGCIYIDNGRLIGILKSDGHLRQEFRPCFSGFTRGVIALIGRLVGSKEIGATIRTNNCFNVQKQITTTVNERLVKCNGPFAQGAVFHNCFSLDCGISLDGHRCARIFRSVGIQIL